MVQANDFSSELFLDQLPFFDGNPSTDQASEAGLAWSNQAISTSFSQDLANDSKSATKTGPGSDMTFAQVLPRLTDVTTILDQHTAQKWAAAEVKLSLDAEFARRLQSMEEQDEDWHDLDSLDMER